MDTTKKKPLARIGASVSTRAPTPVTNDAPRIVGRRSGRTRRMMEAAIEALDRGKSVTVLVENDSHTPFVAKMFDEMTLYHSVRMTKKLRIITYEQALREGYKCMTNALDGTDVVLIDHHVFEQRDIHMFRQWLVWNGLEPKDFL